MKCIFTRSTAQVAICVSKNGSTEIDIKDTACIYISK